MMCKLTCRMCLSLGGSFKNIALGWAVFVHMTLTFFDGIAGLMGHHLDTGIESRVNQERREASLGQKGCVVWLTGLSGSGKTTVAVKLEEELFSLGKVAYILDGDKVRQGLCSDLGFSDRDREENIRRVSELARLFADSGLICITAFISPFRAGRKRAKEIIGAERFLEIYLSAPLDVCEERDVKGLYKRARAGEIEAFTGVSSPYEAPEAAALVLDTATDPVEKSAEKVIRLLLDRDFIRDNNTK